MHTKFWIRSAVLLSLLALVGSGIAWAGKVKTETVTVEGVGDWTATELFNSTDVAADLTEWQGLDEVDFRWTNAIAEDSGGGVFVFVFGREETSSSLSFYTGVVRADLTGGFTHVVQELAMDASFGTENPADNNSIEGSYVDGIHVVGSTGGDLTAGDLLLLRVNGDTKSWNGSEWTGDNSVELVRYPVDSTATATVDADSAEVLFTWDAEQTEQGGVAARNAIATDGSGNIYLTAGGFLDSSGASLDQSIRKLTWNGTSYSDSELVTDIPKETLAFHGTRVYARSGTDRSILQIDPDTGATSTFASYGDGSGDGLAAFAFDGAGTLWAAVYDQTTQGGERYITEAPSGGSTSADTRIADLPLLREIAMTSCSDGGLFVVAPVSTRSTSKGSTTETLDYYGVFWLSESAGSGGGDGGGGGGNGKGNGKGPKK